MPVVEWKLGGRSGLGAPPALSGDADSRQAKGLELLPRPLWWAACSVPCGSATTQGPRSAGTQERSSRSAFEEREGEEEENDQKKEEKERKKKRNGHGRWGEEEKQGQKRKEMGNLDKEEGFVLQTVGGWEGTLERS